MALLLHKTALVNFPMATTVKTENVKYLTSPPKVVLQDTKKFFEGAHWDVKNY